MSFFTRLRPLARALSHPSYRNYAIGNGFSVVGTWMQRIAAALTASGFRAREVDKIMGGNWRRLLTDVLG